MALGAPFLNGSDDKENHGTVRRTLETGGKDAKTREGFHKCQGLGILVSFVWNDNQHRSDGNEREGFQGR